MLDLFNIFTLENEHLRVRLDPGVRGRQPA